MSIKVINGNIFNSKCQTIVNTVNCVGVMGKGIALVYKLRYPDMYITYKKYCEKGLIKPGILWLYNKEINAPAILNFPTKNHWKYPSKIEWLALGLLKFVDTYKEKGITSIAFPLLGTHNGGLSKDLVLNLMKEHLGSCTIPIEIYDYDPGAEDDLFELFKKKWLLLEENDIKVATGIQPQYARKITKIIIGENVSSMISLVNYKGIGKKTLEKAFGFILNQNSNANK